MAIPQRRPGPGMRRPAGPARPDSSELLDRLVQQGRITAGQAAQYRVWESAKPPIDGGRQRFDAWMASRPDLPGMPPMGPAAMARRPGPGMGRSEPGKGREGPGRASVERVLGMLDQLERDNEITEAQAEQVRRWAKTRPNDAAGQDAHDAWMKRRPDVPGLRELWGSRPE